MESLEDLSVKQLIQTYPSSIIEKIVEYGSIRLKKENEREVVIKFKYVDADSDDKLTKLIKICDFMHEMKIVLLLNDK